MPVPTAPVPDPPLAVLTEALCLLRAMPAQSELPTVLYLGRDLIDLLHRTSAPGTGMGEALMDYELGPLDYRIDIAVPWGEEPEATPAPWRVRALDRLRWRTGW